MALQLQEFTASRGYQQNKWVEIILKLVVNDVKKIPAYVSTPVGKAVDSRFCRATLHSIRVLYKKQKFQDQKDQMKKGDGVEGREGRGIDDFPRAATASVRDNRRSPKKFSVRWATARW